MAVTFSGPDTSFTHKSISATNVYVRDAGDIGITFHDAVQADFTNIQVVNVTNIVVVQRSSFINTFDDMSRVGV